MMQNISYKKSSGFTLIELLLVIAVMGFIISNVRFPNLGDDPFDLVEKQARTLKAQIDLASEYAVLNNAQLGLAVAEASYAFLIFDGNKWQTLSEPPFAVKELAEDLQLELSLDGLAWQEDNLLSAVEFIDEEALEQESEKTEEEKKLAFPQVFLLSSGELSPFDLKVIYDNGFDDTISFLIRGKFTTPVHLYDPLQQDELD